MCNDRPWKLVAPWWRWPRQREELGREPRRTRPVIQKYETSDPVSLFVKDPQKSLAFLPVEDFVQRVEKVSPSPTGPTGKLLSFFDYRLQTTGTRKVFLPSHKRFYLVICELHCDAPGFPSVKRDRVCQAGMVVRRQRLSYGLEFAPRAAELVARAGALTAQIARIDHQGEKRILRRRHRVTRGGVVGAMAGAVVETKSSLDAALRTEAARKRAELDAELGSVRTELHRWKVAAGAMEVGEGWIPSDTPNVGEWHVVGEKPDEAVEQFYPLYPLVPDPRSAGHDATGMTLYFGLLPTGGREVEPSGIARFDERSRYQVRCFVRRHRCDCPRTGEPNDCGGELVWSEPSEVFQVAAHFDAVGTGNLPVTIQLPDLRELAAAPGARLPVAMTAPEDSSLQFTVDTSTGQPQNAARGGFQICYLSIPLITIIAWFVLNLFLPIVVFVFQLWFLLGLKFCIPPSISLGAGAGLHADLEGEIQLELDAGIDINLITDVGILAAADFNLATTGDAAFNGDLENPVLTDPGSPGAQLHAAYENAPLRGIQTAVTADRSGEVTVPGPVWEERVERSEVFA